MTSQMRGCLLSNPIFYSILGKYLNDELTTTQAANEFGIHRRTMWNYLKDFGVLKPAITLPQEVDEIVERINEIYVRI